MNIVFRETRATSEPIPRWKDCPECGKAFRVSQGIFNLSYARMGLCSVSCAFWAEMRFIKQVENDAVRISLYKYLPQESKGR